MASQPAVTAVTLNVELHPHETRAITRGTYLIENRTGAPLPAVHLRLLSDDLKLRSLEVEGARRTRLFKEFDYEIHTFESQEAADEWYAKDKAAHPDWPEA